MRIQKYLFLFCAIAALVILPSFTSTKTHQSKFPFADAGLTERQAAAHLLSRFTFGATPNQVDEVVTMGLEKWFQQQLKGQLSETNVNERLKDFDALSFTNGQVLAAFPRAPQVRKMAVKDGILSKDSIGNSEKKEIKQQLEAYRKQKGLRDEKELYRQFISQKIIRATYSQNQLHQVLTDFWFNNFNVSATKPQCAQFIPAYERDVIRPNVAAKFQDLLMATAHSPAMLLYLDNSNSAIANEDFENKMNQAKTRVDRRGRIHYPKQRPAPNQAKPSKKAMGLNENYAREIMELHTLGVDGGYTQKDVTEAARVLTGWTIYPMAEGYSENVRKILEKTGESRLAREGFVHKGDFLFAINRHDAKEKRVLGKIFKAGGGYHDGVELLTLLAHHPSTANFICKKLAVRFVSDSPPVGLVEKMTKTFLDEDGDIKKILTTMVQSPEFWNKETLRAKTKSPFEYAISAVRSLNGEITNAFPLFQSITQMGQKLYSYAAPTGFPDRGQYWINTGSLLNRMNFGLALAANRIKGLHVDLVELNNHHEPESAVMALSVYAKLMLPERDLESTFARLTPIINDQRLEPKIKQAANERTDKGANEMDEADQYTSNAQSNQTSKKSAFGDSMMVSQVVGVIVGSPEFQRR
jgi:uncharacterized protein (DUF1800 family)